MKRILLLLALLASPLAANPLRVDLNAKSAILINAKTGAVLYEKNAMAKQYPASITKIATALYLIEQKGDVIDSAVKVSQGAIAAISSEAKSKSNYRLPSHWIEFGSNHIGLKSGEEVTLRTLLYGLMLSSGNDAANAIAEAVSGSVPAFMEELNERLKELGCQETNFTNPHGLHHPDHSTSARDMALIAQEAMKHPLFRQVVASCTYTKPESNKQEKTIFLQRNRLLKSGSHYYEAAVGVKTGYTKAAKGTFVAAANDGERTLIAVLFQCDKKGQIFAESRALFDAAFAQSKVRRPLIRQGEQTFVRKVVGAARPIRTVIDDAFALEYYPAEEPIVRGEVAWEPLELPIAQGEQIGEVRIVCEDGSILQSLPLLAKEDVGATLLHQIQSRLGNLHLWGRGAKVAVLLSTGSLLVLALRKKR